MTGFEGRFVRIFNEPLAVESTHSLRAHGLVIVKNTQKKRAKISDFGLASTNEFVEIMVFELRGADP